MKYIIINKWQLKGVKPQYYLREVIEDLDTANKKLKAHKIIESAEEHSFYIVPFDESVLLLDKKVA